MSTDKPPDGQWRVVRVDTEPMTTQEYDQAVTALASLIGQWKRNQENTEADHESQHKGTIPLPLPRETRDNGTGTDTAR